MCILPRPSHWVAAVALLIVVTGHASAVDSFEQPPISYSESAPQNPVAQLQAALDQGTTRLEFVDGPGYLRSVLTALHVPIESQVLVFSKTSLQRSRISPNNPRAVYFNDDVYVGYCRSGEVMEVSVADPQLGAVFYTLDQERVDRPTLVRQTDNCLICHSSSRTAGVPGHLVRSVAADLSGEPIVSSGSINVDFRTPIADRWGGWYVTGDWPGQTHRGNRQETRESLKDPQRFAETATLAQLDGRVNRAAYLSPHSDVVALLVLEHQILVHNLLTRANFETRSALAYQEEFNRLLGKPLDLPLDSATRRIETAADELVDALLFVGEAKLRTPVMGRSGFTQQFEQQGPLDARGRSLRHFDLQSRLFEYPCSYLIYSAAFDSLPPLALERVWRRMAEVLTADEPAEKYAHLSARDREAIVEIVKATKTNLPPNWPQISDKPAE